MNKIEYGTEFLDQLKDSVHDLYDENKELKKEIEILQCDLDNANSKLRDSMSIRLRAIEYIEDDLSHATSNGKLHRKHLLDILKGVDKD